MTFHKTIPILRIFDEHKAEEFYINFLGFTVDWSHRFDKASPLYMQISQGDCVLHLSEHYGDGNPGAALRIQTDELAAYCQELRDKDYKYCRPEIQIMPWETRDMSVRDPFGNRLVFTEAIST